MSPEQLIGYVGICSGRGQPLQTLLTLREDGVWLPDALSNSKCLSKVKGAKALWQSWEQIDG